VRNLPALLKPFALFYAMLLCAIAVFRLFFVIIYAQNAASFGDLIKLLAIGVRMDTIAVCALLTPIVIYALLFNNRPSIINRVYLAFCAFFLIFFEVVSAGFFDQFGLRPNHLFFDYLDHPQEIFYMLVSSYAPLTAIGVLLTCLAAFLGYKIGAKNPRKTPLAIRLIALPCAIAILFIGVRSSFGASAANLGATMFSRSQALNEIASNGAYSALYALYQLNSEVDLSDRWTMSEEEIFARTGFGARVFSSKTPENPPNIIIVLWESMGAEFIGALGGMELSPSFDALAKNGALFTNTHATGTRTNRGVEAVLAGFSPIVKVHAGKLPKAQNDFWTIANHLKPLGYECEFFYGGDANFDNMSRFLGANGFAIHSYFALGEGFSNKWGSDDLSVFTAANRVFAKSREPFCAAILTLSSHLPFDYPSGFIKPVNAPAATKENAALFADYALGEFFNMAKKESYYENTIFLIVADHTIQVRGGDPFAPLEKYRVPALFFGKGVSAAKSDAIASQIDLLPTLLALIGDDRPRPLIGRDLLGEQTKGGAVMLAGADFAYRTDDTITILRSNGAVTQAKIDENGAYGARSDFARGENGEYVRVQRETNASESPLDKEHLRDAIARLLLPVTLYEKRLHSAGDVK
jgi:phosphoglycerol transferase MdoB-like AlkP superfamily enzyme